MIHSSHETFLLRMYFDRRRFEKLRCKNETAIGRTKHVEALARLVSHKLKITD